MRSNPGGEFDQADGNVELESNGLLFRDFDFLELVIVGVAIDFDELHAKPMIQFKLSSPSPRGPRMVLDNRFEFMSGSVVLFFQFFEVDAGLLDLFFVGFEQILGAMNIPAVVIGIFGEGSLFSMLIKR